MVRATRGVPVTVTGSLKSTVTSISSPARKTSFPPASSPWAVPEIETPVTVGATRSAAAPSTTAPESLLIAWAPKPSAAALFAASAIVPPFSASAEVPMLIPSASRSPRATV